MVSRYKCTGALTGAFMMAAPMAQAQFYDPWLYYRRPVIPVPPPVFVIPPDESIPAEFALEDCIVRAMVRMRTRPTGLTIEPRHAPDTENPSLNARTYFMDTQERNGFFSGHMVMIDHQKEGTGSLSISSFHLHANNKDLDPETPQPVGQGTITRIKIAKEDVGPPGPRDTFSGADAKKVVIDRVKDNASEIVDEIRVCMGSGPYIPGTNQLKPQLKNP